MAEQAKIEHPLATFGYRNPPNRLREIWLILTGRITLHAAWQRGYDDHIRADSARRARGGQ